MGKKKWKKSEVMWGYFLIAPAISIIAIFALVPVGYAIYYSFTDYSLFHPPYFIGLENFKELFADEDFWQVVKNTLFYLIGVPVGLFVALFLASLLNDRTLKLAPLYRSIYFVPVILPMISIGAVWIWIFNVKYGLMNHFLGLLGIKPIPWLTSYEWSKIPVIITGVWQGFGGSTIILLAGMQNIPGEVYEAAKLDGARGMKMFFRITLPLLSQSIVVVTIMSAIASFQIFDLVMVLTGGGPGRSSASIVQFIYEKAFRSFEMGYASAAAALLFVVIFIVSIVQLKISQRITNY